MKNNHAIDDAATPDVQEIEYMKERLTRCLQLLKINQDDQISKTAFELIEKSSDQARKLQYGNWISALNTIAGSCLLNQRTFSQSQVYDFLTVAVTTSLESRTKAIDNIIFRIYKDIMAIYESSDDKLKIAYPKIIVDVVAILARGVNASGKKIPVHNVEGYYQMRKSDAVSISVTAASEIPVAAAISVTANATAKAASIESIEEPLLDKAQESKLVDVLTIMTGRSKNDIQVSVAKLEGRDIERIKDLCKNYQRLQKYSKLITDADNLQKFKTALQNERGRKLSDHQLQHAAHSVRKVRLYIENVLDGKFTPHGSYGINHTKHNLEYGYLVVGLMQSSRKKGITTTTEGKI